MKHLNPYTLALLLNEGKFSCVKASKQLGFVSHDALTRQLYRAWQYGAIQDWSTLPKDGLLVYDETVVCKPHAPRLANAQWVYDASQNRSVLGYKLLLILWVVGQERYILRVCLPGTEKSNELIRRTLPEISDAGLAPEHVLFDCWYASCENLTLLEQLGWTYTSRVRSNRVFNGQHVKKHKFHGAKGKTGHLKGISHRVQVVKDGNRFLVTNDLTPHTTASLAKVYEGRWGIETVFRDLKQVLHLEKCACRSLEAQFNHIMACLEAYLYLRQAFPDKSIEAAQQEFLRQYHCPNCRPCLIQ